MTYLQADGLCVEIAGDWLHKGSPRINVEIFLLTNKFIGNLKLAFDVKNVLWLMSACKTTFK